MTKVSLRMSIGLQLGAILLLSLNSPSIADPKGNFVPDAGWDASQLASLQQAELLLKNLQSNQQCKTGSETNGEYGKSENCLDQSSDMLLEEVRSATALYPNLSAAVILKTNCRPTSEGHTNSDQPITSDCVQNRLNNGLSQVQLAIRDIQNRSKTRETSALATCQQQRDFLQQSLNELKGANFNSLTARDKEIKEIIDAIPQTGKPAGKTQ